MLRTLKAIFLGVPAEARKHSDLLRRSKPQAFTEEDGNAILKIAKRGFQMKFFCLASASSAFYLATPVIPLLPPILIKTAAFFLTYRCLSVPVLMRVERQFKEISVKYDLENKPELIWTEEEMKQMWRKMKNGSWEKEEKEKAMREKEAKNEGEKKEKEGEVEGGVEGKGETQSESAPASPEASPTETASDSKPKAP